MTSKPDMSLVSLRTKHPLSFFSMWDPFCKGRWCLWRKCRQTRGNKKSKFRFYLLLRTFPSILFCIFAVQSKLTWPTKPSPAMRGEPTYIILGSGIPIWVGRELFWATRGSSGNLPGESGWYLFMRNLLFWEYMELIECAETSSFIRWRSFRSEMDIN